MGFENVNLFAVVVAAVASFVFGSLWYSPLLFGNLWMKLAGIDKHKAKKAKGMAPQFVGYFIAMLVMSFVLANVFYYFQAESVVESLKTGFLMWLGFIGTITLGSVLWEGKSLKLYALNSSYNILSLFLMGIILVLWP